MESTRKGGIHFGLPVVCIIKKLKSIKQLDVHSMGKVAGDLIAVIIAISWSPRGLWLPCKGQTWTNQKMAVTTEQENINITMIWV